MAVQTSLDAARLNSFGRAALLLVECPKGQSFQISWPYLWDMQIDQPTKDILNNLVVDDTAKTVTITQQLARKQYQTVNELLVHCGGSWSRKAKAHCFTIAPSQALKVLFNDTGTVTTTVETAKEKKKTFQAFYTPDVLADRLIDHAEYFFPHNAPERILEPSAGNGQLVRVIQRKWKDAKVDVCEIQTELHPALKELGCNVVGSDFLHTTPLTHLKGTGEHSTYFKTKYDLVVSNPPFNKHQDLTHVQHAYNLLADGGVLISIMGCHSFHASHKADIAFRQWLNDVEAEVYDIEAGAFKESGTMIPAKYIVVRK